MGAFSIWHWLVVLAVILLIFGPGRLGNLGKDLGKSIKEFREAMSEKNVTPTPPDKIEGQASQTSAPVNESQKEKV
jgi:sec-independent protein translocase protein TatA